MAYGYDDLDQQDTITAWRARQEIEKTHNLSFAEFQEDCGRRAFYKAHVVFAWLGY